MSDGTQIAASPAPVPSTLARVATDLTASRGRMDQAAADIEGLADALCGPLAPSQGAIRGGDPALPPGSVNVLDALAAGLSTPAERIEAATARIRAAIG